MSTENDAQIKQTAAFIALDPVSLVLKPKTKVLNDAGGFTWNRGTPRSPQTFRLIASQSRTPEVSASSGRVGRPQYVLVALPTASVAKFDEFTYDGVTYEIAQIRKTPMEEPYEVKGDVVVFSA